MPMYCPTCLEEYREGVQVCADCEVALVGSRDAAEAARREQAAPASELEPAADDDDMPEVSVFAATLEVAEMMCDLLVGSQCPAYVDEAASDDPSGFRVAVPLEFAPRAGQILHAQRRRLVVSHTEDGRGFYEFRDASAEAASFPVLGLTIAEIQAGGITHIPALLEVLAEGHDDDVEAAGARLRALGEPGIVSVLDLLARHASEVTEGATIHAFSVLAGCKGQPLPPAFAAMVATAEQPLVRRDLLRVPGLVGDRQLLPLLVEYLDDEDAQVRYEAIDSLWAITGESLDYDPDAPPEERAPSVEAWRARVL